MQTGLRDGDPDRQKRISSGGTEKPAEAVNRR